MRRTIALSAFLAILAGALFASPLSAGTNDEPDLVGMPNLIVRTDILAHQWVVRDETFAANLCSVIEGGVTPGDHRVVRFTVMTPNIGDADIYVGNPQTHIDLGDGLFEFASCHAHYHFRHYAKYELLDPATGQVWRAAKRGFCMLDTDPNPSYLSTPARDHQLRACGSTTRAGNQGISSGWADTYRFFLGGQYFVLDGGDGQPEVPAGTYTIRITVNPPFVAQSGEPCPHSDPQGFCHQLLESNYADNVGEVTLYIPAHPGKEGVGPLAGTPTPSREDEIEQDDSKKAKK